METKEDIPTQKQALIKATLAALIAVMAFLIVFDLYSMFTERNPHYTGSTIVSSKEHIEGKRNLSPGGGDRPDQWTLTLCPVSGNQCFLHDVSEADYQQAEKNQTIELVDGRIAR